MHVYFQRVLLVTGLFFASVSHAVEEQVAKLESTIEAALDVIYAEGNASLSVDAKQSKVRDLLEARYDLNVIIRRAIGRNWQRMSASEQTRVVDLVKQLIVKAYVNGVDGTERPNVSLGKLVKISDKRAEIDSTVQLDGKTYHVLYRLGRMASGWQIYDIVAENISVVSNYRQQIDDHFRRGDAKGLISRLEKLLEEDEINEDLQI